VNAAAIGASGTLVVIDRSEIVGAVVSDNTGAT